MHHWLKGIDAPESSNQILPPIWFIRYRIWPFIALQNWIKWWLLWTFWWHENILELFCICKNVQNVQVSLCDRS